MHVPSLDAIMGQWPIQGFAITIQGMMPISQSGALEMEMRIRSTAWHAAVAWMTQIRDCGLAVLSLGGFM